MKKFPSISQIGINILLNNCYLNILNCGDFFSGYSLNSESSEKLAYAVHARLKLDRWASFWFRPQQPNTKTDALTTHSILPVILYFMWVISKIEMMHCCN